MTIPASTRTSPGRTQPVSRYHTSAPVASLCTETGPPPPGEVPAAITYPWDTTRSVSAPPSGVMGCDQTRAPVAALNAWMVPLGAHRTAVIRTDHDQAASSAAGSPTRRSGFRHQMTLPVAALYLVEGTADERIEAAAGQHW